MKKDKMYVAKVNLPGCKKGQIIIWNGHYYEYKNSGGRCQYEVETEPEFFMQIKQTIYKNGIKCIIKPHNFIKSVIKNSNGDYEILVSDNKLTVVIETEILDWSYVHGMYVISYNGKLFLINEKKIQPIVTYWFINSTMDPCEIRLGKDAAKDSKRLRLGNYFKTKEECQIGLKTILQTLKNIK